MIKGRIRSGRFLRFTVAFIIFLAHAEGSNPAGLFPNLTKNNPSSVNVKIQRNRKLWILPLTKFAGSEIGEKLLRKYGKKFATSL